MGTIERFAPDADVGIEPDYEALIFLNDDNEQTCHVEGPNAKAMAAQIVEAVSSHASLKARAEQAERAVDVLESNARVQAKLLADTGRKVEELIARGIGGNAYPLRTPLDLTSGELSTIATEAFTRAAVIEECAQVAAHHASGWSLTPGGLARQDTAEEIYKDILALSSVSSTQQLFPGSDDGQVVARANAGKQMIAAGPALTGTSEDTTQGDRPAATVKVPSSEHTEPTRAILFAVAIDDHFDRLEFLQGWIEGDTSEWPEFVRDDALSSTDGAAR